MINEDKLWYKRGDLVEFNLNLGGGPKTCKGLVLNTAVLFGRGEGRFGFFIRMMRPLSRKNIGQTESTLFMRKT